MANCQVTCITKPNPNSPHEHITHIGGGTGSDRWKLTREDAIRRIEQKIDSFYVIGSRGDKAWVGVVRPDYGPAYLRTYADGKWNDNLLALSQCPL
ncbi:MAG: DUF3892 domain-containing protein [Patescibacteria group bacterium]